MGSSCWLVGAEGWIDVDHRRRRKQDLAGELLEEQVSRTSYRITSVDGDGRSNPEGVEPLSPRLRYSATLGTRCGDFNNPDRVASYAWQSTQQPYVFRCLSFESPEVATHVGVAEQSQTSVPR